jgi:curved DNA-binding protein CbpA
MIISMAKRDYYDVLGVPKNASTTTSRRPTASWP